VAERRRLAWAARYEEPSATWALAMGRTGTREAAIRRCWVVAAFAVALRRAWPAVPRLAGPAVPRLAASGLAGPAGPGLARPAVSGLAGRAVPGAAGRAVPGAAGRAVPGVARPAPRLGPAGQGVGLEAAVAGYGERVGLPGPRSARHRGVAPAAGPAASRRAGGVWTRRARRRSHATPVVRARTRASWFHRLQNVSLNAYGRWYPDCRPGMRLPAHRPLAQERFAHARTPARQCEL
jgi:hypothetical protein